MLFGGAANAAAPVCLTLQNGAPQLVQGSGQGSSQNIAQTKAQSDWTSKTMGFGGGAYQSWFAAAKKNVNCTSTKVIFSWTYSCTVIAQPCK
jgi:hypothetical protein